MIYFLFWQKKFLKYKVEKVEVLDGLFRNYSGTLFAHERSKLFLKR